MSFDNFETSKELGRPFELYRFVYGPDADQYYLYTNATRDITAGVDGLGAPGVFKRLAIGRDPYRTTGKAERDTLTLNVPVNSGLANLFLDYPPPSPVGLTIWQGHYGDPDEQLMVVWVGRVLSAARQVNQASLSCEGTLISLKRPGLKRNFQVGCPYVLYGTQCKADRDTFSKDILVIDVVDGMPVFEAGWSDPWPAEKFRGGMVRWQSDKGLDRRTIRQVEAERIIINAPWRDLVAGDTVRVFLGCNHQITDCLDVFDNIQNYGGQPWLPLQNPVKYPNFW